MDLPTKPSDSSAVLHYLFQLGHKGKCSANVHKLQVLWHALFGFVLDPKALPSKSQITQYALVTRAVLYLYATKASHLPTQVVQHKAKAIKKDKVFHNAIVAFLDKYMTKDEMGDLHSTFSRPIAGSPMYVKMFNIHRARLEHMNNDVFTAWTTIANMAGDTNTTFKPSTLKPLPKELRLGFERHDLKKGKVVVKAKARPQKAKRKAKALTQPPSKKKPYIGRYPDPPPNGWVGLITGTALCNFITHMNPISGHDLQIQMAKVGEKAIILMKASVEKNFILQTTANMTLFNTTLDQIPGLIVNAQETSVIAKHFIKTAVCLIFNPENNEYHGKPTLTFASTAASSSISFTLLVKMVEHVKISKHKSTFHALSMISMSIQLLKPLMSLDKIKDVHILCQVDNAKKRLYITLETPKSAKTNVCATNRFSAELAKSSANAEVTAMDAVSLFVVDTSNMYMGKLVPTSIPKITNLRAYAQAKASNSLQTIFSETYKLGLLKAITKGIPCKQKICLIMTRERMLLMSIHEYRGSIQVAQLPNILSTS